MGSESEALAWGSCREVLLRVFLVALPAQSPKVLSKML